MATRTTRTAARTAPTEAAAAPAAAGPATLADVARVAGVSSTTASFVLNGRNAAIPEATRERVMAAARTLRYAKSAIVAAQREGRSRTIGVHFNASRGMIPSDPVMARVLAGVSEAAQEREHHLLLYTGLPSAQAEAPPVESFLDRRVDGMLLIAPLIDSDLLAEMAAAPLPAVVLFSQRVPERLGFVDADGVAGAKLAMDHLFALGHRRIAHISDSPRSSNFLDRRLGYEAALAERGIPLDPALVIDRRGGDWDKAAVLRSLLSLPDPPTAVFGHSDGAAVGVLQAAWQIGVKVPEELSVVGFDDCVLATTVSPPLTTVRQPLQEMGRLAASALIDLVTGVASPADRRITVPVELVGRGTTAAPFRR